MKKLGKKIEEMLDSLKDNQSMFTMCANDKGDFFYAHKILPDEMAAGIATILNDGFNDEKEGAKKIAEAIVHSVAFSLIRGGKTADRIMEILRPAYSKLSLLDLLERISDDLKKKIDDDDEDEDDEDGDDDDDDDDEGEDVGCANCPRNIDCKLQPAVKYREENGVESKKKCGKHTTRAKNEEK